MLPNGRHTLGPDNATLQVRTSREGAYAKAGHDLVMDVDRWEGILAVDGERITLELSAEPRSLRVRWGFNGTTSLTDANRADISNTIDAKVIRGAAISFRSRSITPRGDAFVVTGDLTIGQSTSSMTFELRASADGSRVDAVANVVQSHFGIKPYSAMLGTLKVRDAVEIVARATLPLWSPPVVWEGHDEHDSQENDPAPLVEEAAEPTPQADAEPVLVAAGFVPPQAGESGESADFAAPAQASAPSEPYDVAASPVAEQAQAPAAAPAPASASHGMMRLRWPR